jgi:hypothetical protein
MKRFFILSFITFSAICCSPKHRSGDISGASDIDFNTTGMPFSELVEKVFEPAGCFDCHGKYKKYETVLKIIIPGDALMSKLYLRASTDMPPIEEGYMPLTDEQVQTVRDWIDQGANP